MKDDSQGVIHRGGNFATSAGCQKWRPGHFVEFSLSVVPAAARCYRMYAILRSTRTFQEKLSHLRHWILASYFVCVHDETEQALLKSLATRNFVAFVREVFSRDRNKCETARAPLVSLTMCSFEIFIIEVIFERLTKRQEVIAGLSCRLRRAPSSSLFAMSFTGCGPQA